MWLGRGIFLCVIMTLLIMRTVVSVIRIDGRSMNPTLRDGQWTGIDLVSKYVRPWQLGDVVMLRFPGDPLRSMYVKRIIGLPGDSIAMRDGRVMRNNVPLEEPYLSAGEQTQPGALPLPKIVPDLSYIVLGDNRQISNDSRFFGVVPASDLIARVAIH